jgi:tetratricopeptide (TPR) repeat protein
MTPRAPFSRTLLVHIFLFCGCATCSSFLLAQRRFPNGPSEPALNLVTLGGWVHPDYGKRLPAGVMVHLETSEGMMAGDQPINDSGYFEFGGLTRKHYRLTIIAPGFQPYARDVDLGTVGNRLTINVHLSPSVNREEVEAPISHSFTDDSAPPKARKEYEKGAQALRQSNLSAAQGHLQKAVKEYPCYVRAQTDLAVALSQEHDLMGAEAALKKALACDPDYLDVYSELGQLYFDEKKYQDSQAVVEQGIRRSPASWQFYFQSGANHFHLGQYGKAEDDYLKAESFNSSLPPIVHVRLADVYLKEYAYAKAFSEMQAYLQVEPAGPYAAKIKSLMQQMMADHVVPLTKPDSARSTPPHS